MTDQQTSQELAVRVEQSSRLDGKQLAYIANTDFVPKAYRGNVPAIMACVQMGREMGLGDMESLRMIHVIDGRPSMAAELMVKRARQAGHSIRFEQGDGWAKAHGKRADNGDTFSATWTLERAKAMGLLSKSNWQKMQSTMLLWRSASELCRLLFPDVLGGVIYTPDEAEMTAEERVAEALSSSVPDTPPPDDEPVDGEIVDEGNGGGTMGTDGHATPDAAVEAPVAEAASSPAGQSFADMVPPGARGES